MRLRNERPGRLGRRVMERARRSPAFAALDLGSNTCRLLIVEPSAAAGGFRVIDSYSEIVRLGAGMAASGALSPAAMERALNALKTCAARLARRPDAEVRCAATEACRFARNGAAFLDRVRAETGLAFEIIDREEEARLAGLGCAELIDSSAGAALVIDVGGASTELIFLDPARPDVPMAWTSLAVGVVTLSERRELPFEAMADHVRAAAAAFDPGAAVRAAWARPGAHAIGCSGAATALAGLLLDLARYDRARVDGLWLDAAQLARGAAMARALGEAGLAAHPCIGRARADLVIPGAAIIEGILSAWPCSRFRVADRGLREGMLLSMMRARQ